jgi:electron transfer flavoprotein beta subunit
MKIAVCMKEAVADRQGQLMFLKNGLDIDPTYATLETNEADLYALEAALQLCEAAGGGEVVVVSVGDARVDKMLQKCVAMGATRPLRVWSDDLAANDPMAVARALATAIEPEQPDLVLCGIQSSDAAQQSTGPALSGFLGRPCVTAATQITVSGGVATVHSERDGGLVEVIEVDLPAIITVQTGINTPRAGSFKQLMLAKKTPIKVVDAAGVASPARLVKMREAPAATGRAEILPGSVGDVASRIIALVKERSA